MPITLFLSFSVTGKREWACSITKGINLSGEFADVDHIHLGTGNHDIARLHFRNLYHAFNHAQRIGVEQIALISGNAAKRTSCSRSPGSRRISAAEALKPARFGRVIHTLLRSFLYAPVRPPRQSLYPPDRFHPVSRFRPFHDKGCRIPSCFTIFTLQSLHYRRICVILMIVALKMQDAVYG